MSALFMAAVLALFTLFSGCQSTDSSAPTALESSTMGGSSPSTGNDSANQGASVTAPAPTPIAFGSASSQQSASAPTITAKAALLVDDRGRVLFEKNADMRLPVASTQKLLLGIMIAERGNLSQPVVIEEADTWAEPTIMGIKPGQIYTREELLRAVLVRSSNDIARALARDHSGSVSAFAANMNRRARQLGMYNSYFTNASGLPSPPGQYSTARDLAKLGSASLRNSFVRDAIRTKAVVFRFSNGTTKTVYNTNQVLRHFPYCTGAKTGYTNAAGRCLVSSATYGRRSVIAVILGSKTPNVWSESEALLKYGLGL
ncbi:MAG: D-alanyl-D-alanine carboxypeptidase family protein [Verrucomicrobiota bacterium]